ncbi:MAG: hypothetical protein COU11_03440 [Candidatus Harrisonbacteria bacterium CG10_big_fil_rev_8_21_14_0_10_49_15]|uniref:NYN domain-containing protein n=1 Tax=Candidatus Harrisonbacteria bacterium CG10_big_fil_rev_8_21_14_0_10_49_15 TaxID=1974587 RepID=A0A2H0UKF7_9BACT|nr:MAG: hypothetical protein COU11_03440 [Candidatus Harrisonbacteria bacterium CG10_big_fil_rev_8_21_14_0_10_49_15]
MSSKHSDQRVGIFIDIQNLYHSSKNLYNARVNYKELMASLLGDRKLIRALAYVVQTEGVAGMQLTEEQAKERTTKSESTFFDALKQAGIELRIKDIQVFSGGAKKADWDVGMAIDAVRMAEFLDVVVLVTGDGDFVPLVQYLKWGRGREVEVAAFSRTTNSKLREEADSFFALEEIPKVLIRKRGRRGDANQKAKTDKN